MSRKDWSSEKIFERLLTNKSDKTYWDNIHELRSRATKETFNRCCELIKSEKAKERIIAVDVLAQLGLERPFQKQTLKLYFKLLKNEENPDVIASILYGIGHNNSETLNDSHLKLLASYKDDKRHYIRHCLAFALLTVENQIAIETLIYLMNDKVSDVRDWATFGIGSQIDTDNQEIREALWQRIDDKNQDTKLEAIKGLAFRKDEKVKEIIKRELLDGENGTLLFEAIEEFSDKDFLPLLIQTLEKAEKEDVSDEWLGELKNCIDKLSI